MKLKLLIILVISLYSFSAKAEKFQATISVEVLNEGIRKSILFSDENGDMLYAYNIEVKEYKEDLIINFENPFNGPVHLTIYRANNGVYVRDVNIYVSTRELMPRIMTYAYIPNNFILYLPDNRRHVFSQNRLFAQNYETLTLKIDGVYDLNDTFLHNPYCKIKERIRRDSVIKIKFRHPIGEDLSGFIRVNDEPFYRHIFIPVEEDFPNRMHIKDMEIASDVAKIKLPFKADWRGNVTCENLESGYLSTLTDFTINESFTKTNFDFPISDNVILDDYLITICDLSEYGRLGDTMHIYSKLFQAPETRIFHNRNFDFDIEGIDKGFSFKKIGLFDIFEIDCYVKHKEDEFVNVNVYQRKSLNSYFWKVKIAAIDSKRQFKFIFPKMISEITTFLKLPKKLGTYNDVKFGDIKMVKFEFPLDRNFIPSNVNLHQASIKDSFHKIVVKRHDANDY